MEILKAKKNNELLAFDAYAYFNYRILTDTSISWRCVLSKCDGRLRDWLDDQSECTNDHNHSPDPADLEKRKIRAALKTRAVVADEPSRQTILSIQCGPNRKTSAAVIPNC